MKKFLSLILILCFIIPSAPFATWAEDDNSELDLSKSDLKNIDLSKIDLSKIDLDKLMRGLKTGSSSKSSKTNKSNKSGKSAKTSEAGSSESAKSEKAKIDTDDLLGSLLQVLVEEMVNRRDGTAEKNGGENSPAEMSGASINDKAAYDEIVKVCKSGSLENFKEKFKEYKLTGDAVISYKNVSPSDIFKDDTEHKHSLIVVAAEHSPNAQIIKFLLDNGANANADDGAAIRAAALNARAESVKILLYAGADAQKTDEFGRTALSLAAGESSEIKSRLETIKILLIAGADMNLKDRSGLTSWSYAVKSGAPEVVNYFLDAGADAKYTGILALAKNNSKLAGTQALKRIEAVNKNKN